MEVSTDSTIQTNNMYNYLDPSNYYNYTGTPGINISAILIVAVVIIIFVALFASLANSGNGSSGYSSDGYNQGAGVFGVGILILFILVVFFSGLNYFYGATISSSLSKLFSSTPTIDISVNPIGPSTSSSLNPPAVIPSLIKQPQVFNIPGNYYGYEDAKSLCTAYGARLADYDEVENAYNNGAEWCSYGWSQGQMALFPTQKNTYNELQKIDGHQHDCGRPGVNGGYMANPKLQFGVNCFGVKPNMTEEEEQLMAVTGLYPKTEKEIEFDKKVQYWKTKLHDILVAPFNHNSWSRY